MPTLFQHRHAKTLCRQDRGAPPVLARSKYLRRFEGPLRKGADRVDSSGER